IADGSVEFLHVRVGHRQASNSKAPDQRKLVGGFVFGAEKNADRMLRYGAALSLSGKGKGVVPGLEP
ncbi:hypothetical protein, partial [Pseudomonas nitroreducens]|uniref:hypothetical protein n=1 Tax=Pseudomonas nitroreducens TaxID=46680 RepID=UPI001C52E86E